MNRRLNLGVTALTLAAALALTGCNSNPKSAATGEDPAQCKAVKGETDTVNKMCVVMNEDPVDPDVTPVVWKGQKVGFCCDGCKPEWAKMSGAEKDAAVAKAIKLAAPAQ